MSICCVYTVFEVVAPVREVRLSCLIRIITLWFQNYAKSFILNHRNDGESTWRAVIGDDHACTCYDSESTWRVIIDEDIKRCDACVMNFPDGWHDGVVFLWLCCTRCYFSSCFRSTGATSTGVWDRYRSVVRRCNTVLQLILSVLTGDLSAANLGRNHTIVRRGLLCDNCWLIGRRFNSEPRCLLPVSAWRKQASFVIGWIFKFFFLTINVGGVCDLETVDDNVIKKITSAIQPPRRFLWSYRFFSGFMFFLLIGAAKNLRWCLPGMRVW